jgi:thioredoxin 1
MKRVALTLALGFLAVAAGCTGSGEETGGEHVKTITDASFDADISKGLVLVDFWAPWCPPCVELGPVIHRLAGKFAGRASIGKVNVDEQKLKASQFGITSIPTIIIFKNGQNVEQLVGLQSEETLTRLIEKHLSQ